MSIKPYELLEDLLTGHEMTVDHLNELLRDKVRENQHLEYKHGDELKKGKPGNVIREYISAFANSSGGLLIIGVDESSMSVTGCVTPGGGDLLEWASRATTPITPFLSPLPVYKVVNHPDGVVLVIAVGRSSNLVPLNREGVPAYFFRIHDQTVVSPDFLVSDLVLGRRQHPNLEISFCSTSNVSINQSTVSGQDGLRVDFGLDITVENRSLVWAREATFGLICFQPGQSTVQLSNNLIAFIDAKEANVVGYPGDRVLMRKETGGGRDIKPFDSVTYSFKGLSVPLKVLNWLSFGWKAALYVVTRNSPPIWYQIEIQISSHVFNLKKQENIDSSGEYLSIKKMVLERPVVSWEDRTA